MNEQAQKELDPPSTPLSRGDSGPKVRQVQEWLCLHGFHAAVDGEFGPATDAAVKAFQQDWEGENEVLVANADGLVGPATWRALTESMRRSVEWTRQRSLRDGNAIADCAQAHLAAHPREVGGPNRGPWVRLYMDGHEGPEYPWCAGFATYVLRQVLGEKGKGWRTFSCDALAIRATAEGRMLWGHRMEGRKPRPGDLFLIRRGPSDWHHTGIVTRVEAEYFETIEGNTNTNGAREGTAVHSRHRAFGPNVDFVLMGGDR